MTMAREPTPMYAIEHPYDLIILERRVKAAGNLHGGDAHKLIEALRDAWAENEDLGKALDETQAECARLESELVDMLDSPCAKCVANEKAGFCDACDAPCPRCHGGE